MRVAFGSVRSSPLRNCRDLIGSQRRVIREATVARIGKPGRHRFILGNLADRSGKRAHLLVSLERHGRHLALPVAVLASRLEDRQNVLIEGGSAIGGVRR